jgi:thiamine pyrophosphate-dependent acetolactate synthase large subunit-like protein
MDPIASTSAPPLIASPSVVDKGAEAPPKTKSALKREARRQAQLDARPARRALEKEKKKAKKLEKRKLEEEEGAGGEEREQRVIKKFKKVQEGAARVVIDLGFDEKMNDKVSFFFFVVVGIAQI